MKKTLLLVSILVAAAVSLNAQTASTIVDFVTMDLSTMENVNNYLTYDGNATVQVQSGTADPTIEYLLKTGGETTTVSIKNTPISFTYKHSSSNKRFAKSLATDFRNEGNAFTIVISNLVSGDVVKFYDAGGTGAVMEATGTSSGTVTIAKDDVTSVTSTGGTMTLKVTSNKFRFTKITINETSSSFIENAIAEAVLFDGTEIINNQNLNLHVYNTLGKLVRTSNTNISISDLQIGIYIVRAEGVKGALKISK